ncbi:MAG: glycosyltransferase family 39 protein [Cytophagaceae bacterium]|nr:glycosyltransferase family 39 protein [Cytophagaceae bacterium]MDW8456562.1 glycosyltransferase family 39 protein [Cytophagaceae bacterium]
MEIDNNIFYPRIDIAGEKSGVTGMEFPLLNYMIYIVSEIFGYQHWYGRMINLIISSIGLWFFFRLIKKYFGNTVAFYSTIILMVSIWFKISRKIMPDTFSMSMMIACVYYGINYLENENRKKNLWYLLAYFIFMVSAILSKLPSGYSLVVFIFFYLNKQIPVNRKLIFSSVTFLGLVPVIAWYFYWVPYLVDTYGFWHFFMGKSMKEGFREIVQNLDLTLSRFYQTALKFSGFAVFVYGLVISIINKEWKIYSLFLISLAVFSIVVCKAGFTFAHHNYYIVPFVPIMALVAGYGLSKIKNYKLALGILLVLCIENVGNQLHDLRVKEVDFRIVNLENDLDKISQRKDLILINSGPCPTPMYFAHRKGWVDNNENILKENYVNALKEKGLKYIVILKRSFGSEVILSCHEKVLENEDYCIYKL